MFGLFEAPGRYPFPQPLRVCHSGLVELRVISHPLVDHKLTVLRDRNTEQPAFRSLVEELVTLLAYEATRGVRVHDTAIETPVAPTVGTKLDSPAPLVVPILRAGLGMLDGMLRLVPTAEVGFLGMIRDEKTLEPTTYAERLPQDLSSRQCYVLDPMLATGGSMVATIDLLKKKGCRNITALVLVAAPELVRARAVELVATSEEFLNASWAAAASGGTSPIDLGASSYRALGEVREHTMALGHKWWSLSPFTAEEAPDANLDAGSVHSRQLGITPTDDFRGDVEAAVAHIQARLRDGWRLLIGVEGKGLANRMTELLAEHDITARVSGLETEPEAGSAHVIVGPFRRGWRAGNSNC